MNSSQEQKFFQVRKPREGYFPSLQKPSIIGYWSDHGSRIISYDSSQLQYYSPPNTSNVRLDLNQGIDLIKSTPEDLHEKINGLLEWISKNYETIRANPETKRWLQPNFICCRASLTKIMKTPYDARDGWIICAAKWRGNIYLCAFDTEAAKEAKANKTSIEEDMCSWRIKFKQYMLTKVPGVSPDLSQPVNASEKFACVFRTRLMKYELLYSDKMGGVCSDEKLQDPLPLEKLKFVELKTSRIIETDRHWMNMHRYKLLRWWCQSLLVANEGIVCGFKDEFGVVRQLKNYKLFDIVQSCQEYWTPSVVMHFCDDFLRYVISHVKDNCNKTIYKFVRVPYDDIYLTEELPTSEYAFLPSWFREIH